VTCLRQVVGFTLGTQDSTTNKTGRHDITELLLKHTFFEKIKILSKKSCGNIMRSKKAITGIFFLTT
jgi:hypothetical protein